MGMFDTIKNELYCPYCGTKQKAGDFQTKDFGKRLDHLDLLEIKGIIYFVYTCCYHCNNWIELTIPSYGIHTEKEGMKQIEKKRKILSMRFTPKKKRKEK